MKKHLSMLLAVLMLFAFAASAFAAPELNNAGFYQLETADDMVWFQEQVAAGQTELNAVLMNDLDLSTVLWKPIWNESLYIAEVENGGGTFNFADSTGADMPYWYAGTFDGNGKTITIDTYNNATFLFPANVSVTNPNPIQAGGGLFLGVSDTGIVKNFTLSGKMTLAGFPTEANVRIFASPVAAKNWGTIYNVTIADFIIENNGLSATSIIGAIASLSWGENAVIDLCKVRDTEIYSASRSGQMSLIAGQVAFGAVAKNCAVSDSTITNGAAGYAAGIAGLLQEGGKIVNCTVQGVAFEVNVALSSGFGSTSVATPMIGGIAAQARDSNASMDLPHAVYILDCVVSDSTFRALTEDGVSSNVTTYLGGILGMGQGSTTGETVLIQNCSVINTSADVSATRSISAAGIVGFMRHGEILQCRTVNLELSLLHKGAHASAAALHAGGIGGTMADYSTASGDRQVMECLVDGLSIKAKTEGSAARVTYLVGGIAGSYLTDTNSPGEALFRKCALTGTVNFDVETDNSSGVRSLAYIGGLLGRCYAKVSACTVGDFSITSADTLGETTWNVGILSGWFIGRDTGAYRAELVDNQYDGTLDTRLGDTVGLRAGDVTYRYESGNVPFDASDLSAVDSLFVSFFKGGEMQLEQGQSLELELEVFAGTFGIDMSQVTWTSSNSEVLSIAPATGANVTISALAPGTSVLTCSYTLNGVGATKTITVLVPETPAYAINTSLPVAPEITGTPDVNNILPGDDVDITYDFGAIGVEVIGVDNTGMAGSGLTAVADTTNHKIHLTGKAENAGSYYYDVTLRIDGQVVTQRVPVVIQGGSTPTSRGSSSNCNSGVGAALFALAGLFFIGKRKK